MLTTRARLHQDDSPLTEKRMRRSSFDGARPAPSPARYAPHPHAHGDCVVQTGQGEDAGEALVSAVLCTHDASSGKYYRTKCRPEGVSSYPKT